MRKTVRRDAGSISSNVPNPVDARLGALMRDRRRHVGLSRKGLAAQLGLSGREVRQYEAGHLHFGMDMVALLRIALRVRIGFFADPITPLVRKMGVARHARH
ncbi:helix-turn-helix domain-containing protein [Asticcacaulis taihuensis]|uniref:Helix-turn-helix n=1 Tax=Asticcacaulis taihuensis TaxID=260084 RepID=A0A1G4SSE3_9CAUL|nr:helix-turn-helix transcriptional regulator [Asticcacaulis taihuensis]SCW71209.1 Helix-turn-helix [Asticcacaulis taihuensis]